MTKKTTQKKKRILVVEYDQTQQSALSQTLTEDGYDVSLAQNAEQGLELFYQKPFPVVFTSIVLKAMNGLKLLQKIKQTHPETEVIITTGQASCDTAIAALRSGAYDYLIKPLDNNTSITTIANRALLKWKRTKERTTILTALKEKNEQLIAANIALKDLAARDDLTGLFNHRYFQEAITVEVLRCNRHNRGFSLLFIDVDHLTTYNDQLGHQAGDVALKLISLLIENRLRDSDILSRYGGKKFVAILPEISQEFACQLGEQIRQTIEAQSFAGENVLPGKKLTISLGIATYGPDGRDSSSLMAVVDKRLYKAKQAGHNCCICSD
jgi:diguanylate cyclase (GGDEF)-like protein